MSLLNHKLAMMGVAVALAATAGPAEIEQANRPGPAKPKRKAQGNPSGHMPHQGKREMERRARRISKEEGTP